MNKTCPRCDLGDFERTKRPDGIKHVAITERLNSDEMEAAVNDGSCPATDGCDVEPDGVCPHGHTSWLRVLGVV